MSSGAVVRDGSRRVSVKGIRAKALPEGGPGTVLYAMYASVGLTATLGVRATWNQALLGITPTSSVADSRFLRYWLAHYTPEARSIVRASTQDNLNADQVANFPFPELDVDSQHQIADFLDDQVARIDNIIAARNAQRSRLRESSRADVQTILLKGGDLGGLPSTGWFRGLPANWIVTQLRQGWLVIDCKHRTPEYVESGYPVVSPGDITPGPLDLSRCTRFVDLDDFVDLADPIRRALPGDIIYSRNASAGTAALVLKDQQFTMGQDVCRITSSRRSQEYLYYVLNYLVEPQLNAARIGSTFTRINIEQIKTLRVPVPPEALQESTASVVRATIDTSEQVISVLQCSELRLAELKRSLITAAVTGEFDVSTADGSQVLAGVSS